LSYQHWCEPHHCWYATAVQNPPSWHIVCAYLHSLDARYLPIPYILTFSSRCRVLITNMDIYTYIHTYVENKIWVYEIRWQISQL
jgi:hypothetical protein